MASGRKNYFRHSISARKDPKVVALIDDYGKEAYFHYFALLELCAEIATDEYPENGEFVFMRSTLCRELMVTPSRLTRHLMAIHSSLLGHIVVTEKRVTCSFPNLLKYMGRYETKFTSNSPKERKEKKRKENERKENNICADATASPPKSVEKSGRKNRSEQEKARAREIKYAYCKAYRDRWQIDPVFSVAENSLVYSLIERVGFDEGLWLAGQYPNFNDPWHLGQKHPFSLLISQLNKIRTELKNPTAMLASSQARKQIEQNGEQHLRNLERARLQRAIELERLEVDGPVRLVPDVEEA